MHSAFRPVATLLTCVALGVSSAHGWTFSSNTIEYDGAARVLVADDGDVVVAEARSLLRLDGVTGALEWQVDWPSLGGTITDAVVLPSGGIVASGAVLGEFRVAAYSPTGALLWNRQVPDGGATYVVATADGDVLVVGFLGGVLEIERLDGGTGALEWDLQGPIAVVRGAVLDGNGDLLIAAELASDARVLKVVGATGAVAWSVGMGTSCGKSLMVLAHPSGNVFSTFLSCTPSKRAVLVKHDGATGAELWRKTGSLDEYRAYTGIGVLPTGAIVLGGGLGTAPRIAAMSSVDGAPLWQWTEPQSTDDQAWEVIDVEVDGAGDVVAAVQTDDPVDLLTVRLDGATGVERWRHRLAAERGASANAVVSDVDGDVIVAGHVQGPVSEGDAGELIVVRKIDGTDGASFAGTRCGAAVCGRCARCDAPDVCSTGPRPDCRLPLTATGSQLQFKRGATPASDRLTWKWGKGLASTPADLSDPRRVEDEVLCIYENAVAAPNLLFTDTLAAFDDCGKRPCWGNASGQPAKPTFGYKSSATSPAGKSTTTVKLSAGPANASRFTWKAKGPALALGALGLDTPVRAELRSSTGVCWAANYAAGVSKNTPAEFKAKGGS